MFIGARCVHGVQCVSRRHILCSSQSRHAVKRKREKMKNHKKKKDITHTHTTLLSNFRITTCACWSQPLFFYKYRVVPSPLESLNRAEETRKTYEMIMCTKRRMCERGGRNDDQRGRAALEVNLGEKKREGDKK